MPIHRMSPKLQTIYDHQYPSDGVTVTLIMSDSTPHTFTLTGTKGDVIKTVVVAPKFRAGFFGLVCSYLPQLHEAFA